MLNQEDLNYLNSKGITEDMLNEQLQRFATGFPYLKIKEAAGKGCGVNCIEEKPQEEAVAEWFNYLKNGGSVEKFVPASGAASRMFKNVFEFVTANKPAPETGFEKTFFEGIHKFAFYPALNDACVKAFGKDIDALIADGRYVDVAKGLIYPEGLNYGALPKAVLQFHTLADNTVNTALEEHLEEGAAYACQADGKVNIHFTVSPEHRKVFENLLAVAVPKMEKKYGVKYSISMSEQKAYTDTVAVTTDNVPYRENGKMLFRPAGHGALIENLNEINADVIFVKNIDNVTPHNAPTKTYKAVLGGYLLQIQKKVAEYLKKLNAGNCSKEEICEMSEFAKNTLFIETPADLKCEDLADFFKRKFNRPIRICGMVRNDGEPGGGPYMVYNEDGSVSPQILEAAQIDTTKPDQVDLMKKGSYFNPVDLALYVKDVNGNKFDLKKYVDKNTGLISEKSKGGVAFKALKLPGLWNGSMSDWISVFVEVPVETFNPVKTVNDLLRPMHQ
mgnify:FL=1